MLATKIMSTIFHALVQRRNSHNGLAYIPWSLTYILIGIMFWHGKEDRSPDEIVSLWPGVVPLCVIGVQCLRPTVLGWVVILAFALLCDGFFVYVEFLAYRLSDEQYVPDWPKTALTLFLIVLITAVPVALIAAARPKTLPDSPAA